MKRFIGKRNSTAFKILCLFLAMFFSVPQLPFSVKTAWADTIEDKEQRQQEVRDANTVLNEELDALKDDEAEAQAYSDDLSDQIEEKKNSIDTAITDIATLNTSITELEAKIEESEDEYSDTFELLKKRIRALYEAGDAGTIEVLLNATSLSDFAFKSEMLSAVTAHDKQLCDDITEYIELTKDDKTELKKQKLQVGELKKQLEQDQEDLEVLLEENALVIADIQASESDLQEEIWENEAEDAILQAEIEELIAEQKRKEEEEAARRAAEEEAARQQEAEQNGEDTTVYTPPVEEGYSDGLYCMWPLPGYGTGNITQYYGNYGHMGLDIGVPYGTPIVAAASGTVINASYHWSWGNNVLIYHNGTYSTRYAHMSVIGCYEGQWVNQGEVIGWVGSTGNSTGNHLHFEVYENGYRVNPSWYL